MSKPNGGQKAPPAFMDARTGTLWVGIDPMFHPDMLGALPDIIRADDDRPIKEQLEDRYAHGGGWRPIKGFRKNKDHILRFPGDEPYHPVAMTAIGDELVIFYSKCQLLVVIQLDKSFEVTRVD